MVQQSVNNYMSQGVIFHEQVTISLGKVLPSRLSTENILGTPGTLQSTFFANVSGYTIIGE
jgi:hypothetical protein